MTDSELFFENDRRRLKVAGFELADSDGGGILWRCPDGTTVTHEEAMARLLAADIHSNDSEE